MTKFSYDNLNRPTGKSYSGTGCGATTTSVTYTYDDTANGNKGIGRRTSMTDGAGTTAWFYDNRGQVTKETRTVNGVSGSFVTEWGYNSAGMVAWMKYPNGNSGATGEQVSYAYNSQGALSSQYSSSGIYYVQQARYDSSGRLVQRLQNAPDLASNPAMLVSYGYYPWSTQTTGGRLKTIQAGTFADPDGLQSLEYSYFGSLPDKINKRRWLTSW